MWTSENRCRYDRRHLRYESDLTEAEWSEVGPLIPPAKRGGNRRTVDIRQDERGDVHPQHRMSVARDSEGLAAQEHGPRVPRPMDPRRYAGAIASRALCEVPRTGCARAPNSALNSVDQSRVAGHSKLRCALEVLVVFV